MVQVEFFSEKELPFNLKQQMYVMRANAFKARRKWSVTVQNSMEYDAFDRFSPTYLVAHVRGLLLGSMRILPSTGPTMIGTVFRDILEGQPLPSGHDVAEVSRLCIDPDLVKKCFPGQPPNFVTRALLTELFAEMGRRDVVTLLAVHDLLIERILRQAGWPPRRLGRAITSDTGLTTVASTFRVPHVMQESFFPKRQDFAVPIRQNVA